jgi:hypothetical protein
MEVRKVLVSYAIDIGGVYSKTVSFTCKPVPLSLVSVRDKLIVLLDHEIRRICWDRLLKTPSLCLNDINDVGQLASDRVFGQSLDDVIQAFDALEQEKKQQSENSCIICGCSLPGGGTCSGCTDYRGRF